MGREKRIKIEQNGSSGTPETEKRLVVYEHEIQKLMEIKAEPGNNNVENQITELTTMISELQKQSLEKDRAVDAYRERLQVLETKVAELEEEKWMASQIIKETEMKLSKSKVSEEMLTAKLIKAADRIEKEMKLRELESIRHAEELSQQKAEASRSVGDLRRQLLEAERAADVMECQLAKTEQIVKEMKERHLEAQKAAEAILKSCGNVLPLTEELCKSLRMNVDDLLSVKNNFAGLGDPHASKSLELKITEKRYPQETMTIRTPLATEIIDIIDCDDEFLSSKRGLGANNSRVYGEWMFGADMMRAFQEDDELCLHAVCALYKQHVLASQSTKSSNKRFYHFEALRGVELAGCLIGDDPEHSSLTRTVDEVKQLYPDIVNQCRRLAIYYSSYFTAMPRTNEPLARSLMLVCDVREREGEVIEV